MTDDTDARPQDVGRSHRRKPRAANPATVALLERYHTMLRAELTAALDELTPRVPDGGLGLVSVEPVRPPLAERTKLWTFAMQLARELGTAIDAPPPEAEVAVRGPRARRVDFG